MIRITRAHAQPIGIDFGFDSVKLVQLEVGQSTLSVTAAARLPIPDDVRGDAQQHFASALQMARQMVRSTEFIGRNIVTSLPRELVQVKNLRLPHMPAAEIDAAVQFEARNLFPFDIEQAQIRYLHAGEVRQGSDVREEVIVLAAKNDDVDAFVEQVHRAGLIIESLDFEPCALYRGTERFIRRREDEHDVNVVVDIGERRSQVVIGRGREISFYKPIDIGSQQLQDAVARKLNITPAEARALRRRLIDGGETQTTPNHRDPVRQAVFDGTRSIAEDLAREISLCLRYYSVTFRGQRPTRVRLTGGEASDPHLESILTANLPLPVDVKSPIQSADITKMKAQDRRGSLGEWSIAFGLGLKLTKGYFGSRDGKKRDPSAPREDARQLAEIVPATVPPEPETREVAHA